MQRYTGIGWILLLHLALASVFPWWACAQDLVRAKVGIQIQREDRVVSAKSRDRMRTSDRFRIYVIPEQDAYIYIVYTDYQTVTLLKATNSPSLSPVVLPSNRNVYQVDGASKKELITIICSPYEMKEVLAFFDTDVSYHQWRQLENQFMQKSKVDLSQAIQKPFAIAGNVRAQGDIDMTNPGHQVNSEGEQISLPIHISHATTRSLTFRATELPPGLSIDANTGVISGTISSGAAANSPYHVRVSVSQEAKSSEAIFAWTVDPDPFLQKLQIFSGRSFLVKTYEFTVKNETNR